MSQNCLKELFLDYESLRPTQITTLFTLLSALEITAAQTSTIEQYMEEELDLFQI
jgi:hypothetical protein